MPPPPRPSAVRTPSLQVTAAMAAATAAATAQPPKALNDTPVSTAPSSPNMKPLHNQHLNLPSLTPSGANTPSKARATTLDIPGLTKSKVSPDGRIAQRDIGAKLVIVMVGLPARGKSYIVKKIARYLNWLQHPTKVFNVGERRRVAAGRSQPAPRSEAKRERNSQIANSDEAKLRESVRKMSLSTITPNHIIEQSEMLPGPALAPQINAHDHAHGFEGAGLTREKSHPLPAPEGMDQSATFFDPNNAKALAIREQVALETLDELLNYILNGNGSVGILDATNSTLERRKVIMDHIREVAGKDLNVLFLESQCIDENLLERNMHLKLFGPDYKGQDPQTALEDFKKRVAMYQKSYAPLGEFEEQHNMPYIQMIDVGRKVITHQIRGFLSLQTVSYLMNFNLAPRQIWLTRHGESEDNTTGKLGGDSHLTAKGRRFAADLTNFVTSQRTMWERRYQERHSSLVFPPQPGDVSPPNPEWSNPNDPTDRSFCVWTSMLRRSIETAQYFNDDDFDIKQMKMLDEINAGIFEGMTYKEIENTQNEEYVQRKKDKLQYRYPGLGGESYLDVINRLQKVIVEVERMTDHVLIVGHRSVTRILLAYFMGLPREEVAHLDVPLGVIYMLEPKPYGVDFKAYRWDEGTGDFTHDPDFQLRRATNPYKD
ncbi:putative 6-phosphofructo-2-kinase 1 [Phaeomoniella chlamydospora]|uniref:Putative 6-phosphofructo-2-kinase 1 n=1 Tax=Phaeomoniella chlamydospora TaxID=158046 RepID=A0A0G2E748_PHACM|nr:putative 6-phosphofructo-2-kinase 1 [Phaeomoniella chlamydospora]